MKLTPKLPAEYKWLESLPDGEPPKVIVEGLSLMGMTEIAGKDHNPAILGMARALGIDAIYKSDEVAWCGLFAAYCLTRAGKFIPLKGWDLLRALKFKAFGIPVSEAMLGDVLIFQREGGGHVGFYIAESKNSYFVLGGNQSNKVSITEIDKNRCAGIRRPVYINQPRSVNKYVLTSTGQLSTNEA